jgi:hypothetical protein
MVSRWKVYGIAALVVLALALLYRRRRAFRGARGFALLFRLLVAAAEAWREAVLRRNIGRRIESLNALPSAPGPEAA